MEQNPVEKFVGVLTPEEQEEIFKRIEKHRRYQKDFDKLKRYIMGDPKAQFLVKAKIDSTEMEYWIKNLLYQYQIGNVSEDYLDLIVDIGRNGKKKDEEKKKKINKLKEKSPKEIDGKIHAKSKVARRSFIITLNLIIMIGITMGMVLFLMVIRYAKDSRYYLPTNYGWFLSPFFAGIILTAIWMPSIKIIRQIFYGDRTNPKFRALESFSREFLLIVLLASPMIIFLFSPYRFASDNSIDLVLMKPSFLLSICLFLALIVNFIGGIRYVYDAREIKEPYYYTLFRKWTSPAEIRINSDIFSQTYVSYANPYQIQAIKGIFEISNPTRFSHLFINMLSTLPLFLLSVTFYFLGELDHYSLGFFVGLCFSIGSGMIFFVSLFYLLREGKLYHSILNGLTDFYLYEYDRAFEEAKKNPNADNVAQMDHWHNKIDIINHIPRWPLGFAGKIIALLAFFIEMSIYVMIF